MNECICGDPKCKERQKEMLDKITNFSDDFAQYLIEKHMLNLPRRATVAYVNHVFSVMAHQIMDKMDAEANKEHEQKQLTNKSVN